MKKGERGEIATLLTIAVLLVVGATTFVSSLALKGKKTVSTKAAAASPCPSGKCGSGCFYSCEKNEGYDTTICPTPYLEFACCVADNPNANSEYRIRFYGCTGQPCQNTKINNSLGHLVGCAGYNDSLHESKNFALINNTSVNFPTTSPTAKASANPTDQAVPGSATPKPTVISSQTPTTDPTIRYSAGLTLDAALKTAQPSAVPTTPAPTTKSCENNGGSCIFFYNKANSTNKNDICRVSTQGNSQYDDSYKCRDNNQECCIPITNIPKPPTPSAYSSSSPQPTSCGHLLEKICGGPPRCPYVTGYQTIQYNKETVCTEDCEPNHGICNWWGITYGRDNMPYYCAGLNACVLAELFAFRIAQIDKYFSCISKNNYDCLRDAYLETGCKRCAYVIGNQLGCWDCK